MGTGNRAIAVWVAMVGVLMTAPVLAHHSFAVFFNNEEGLMTLHGVVTEFSFRNPHGLIRLDVKQKDGSVEEWRAETNSPSVLERRGWKKDSLKAGDEVTVEGWRARDGTHHMRMRKVTRADGTVIGVPFELLENN